MDDIPLLERAANGNWLKIERFPDGVIYVKITDIVNGQSSRAALDIDGRILTVDSFDLMPDLTD